MHRPPGNAALRLSDLRCPWPLRAVHNLAEQLARSIETSSRLRLYAAEATQDGLEETAETYRRVDALERRQIVELEAQLRRQLDTALTEAGAGRPDEDEPDR
jgi:hypothetical protein